MSLAYHRLPKLKILGFFHFYDNVQCNVALHNNELDHAQRDFRLSAYGGVVFQQFEVIKVSMET